MARPDFGSPEAALRQRLPEPWQQVCRLIDDELERELPQPLSEETEAYRSGRRCGLLRVITLMKGAAA